jgi:DNA-binding GntR family transcriptional regulator
MPREASLTAYRMIAETISGKIVSGQIQPDERLSTEMGLGQ